MIGPGRLRIGSVDPPGEESLQPRALSRAGSDLLRQADYVVVQPGPGTVRPLLVRLHTLDPAIQIILAPEDERRPEMERALLFTPGVGEVWVASPRELDEALYSRAAEVTRRRRSLPATRARLKRGMERLGAASIERRKMSDAFLAALLEVVPDPVLSVDDEGAVVSANPAAEHLMGRNPAELEGMRLFDALRPEDPPALEALLERGREARAAGELAFARRGGGIGIVEAFIVPVRNGPHSVRCLVLHDVTEPRRIRRELEEQARLLEVEAAERERVNRELVERSDELERAMTARSRFYAAMSHELRTPLNAVIGYQALLLDGLYGELPEEVVAPLRRARSAANHLLDLVRDVLDLSRIESGRIDIEPAPVRVPDVLHELADTIGPLAEKHGSTLEITGPDDARTVVTDPRRLRQILLNLLSNAVKFGEGRPVRAEWSPQPDGGVVIAVVDRGRGIPPEHLREIFEEFVQFGDPGEGGGSGLGLTISRRLTQVIGAELEVDSQVGRGSEFRVRLPARPDGYPGGPEGAGGD